MSRNITGPGALSQLRLQTAESAHGPAIRMRQASGVIARGDASHDRWVRAFARDPVAARAALDRADARRAAALAEERARWPKRRTAPSAAASAAPDAVAVEADGLLSAGASLLCGQERARLAERGARARAQEAAGLLPHGDSLLSAAERQALTVRRGGAVVS